MNLKTIVLLLLALAWAPLGAGELDQFVTADQKDYQQIAALRARFGGAALPQQGSSRGEMTLALAGLATDAATQAPGGDFKNEDYDALYALLQKYRDELRGMGFSQKQLEDDLAALKVRAHELQDRLDKLQPKDGMKINGHVTNIYDDVVLTGPGQNSGQGLGYRHGIIRAQLSLNVVRGIFSGTVEYFLQRVLGDMYSCSTCMAAVNAINIEVRTPIAFQAGDLDVGLTPLTLWRNEDDEPFEPEPFAGRRQELRDQLRLKQDKLRMRGARVFTEAVFFDAQRVELEGLIFGFGLPGQLIYQRGKAATLTGDAPGAVAYNSGYSTYLGAWRLGIPISAFKASYIGTIIKDATDSAHPLVGGRQLSGFDSQVHSIELSLKLKAGFSARAEYAESLFSDPNFSPVYASDYSTGTAMTVDIGYQGERFGVSADFFNVDNSFTSTPAQGRTEDAEYYLLGPFPTENSLFNPNPTGVGVQYGGIGVPEPPESHFNSQIIPPQVLDTAGNPTRLMIPYDWRINPLSPYGLATPNRSGGGVDMNLALFNAGIKLKGGAKVAAEKTGVAGYEPIAYSVFRGGMVIDLAPWLDWPISFSGGYTLSDARNSQKIAFDSALIDAGMEWAFSKALKFQLGGRHIDFNGTLPYYGTNAAIRSFGYVATSQVYDMGGVGLKWALGDDVNLRMDYATILFDDIHQRALGNSPQWEADQGFMGIDIVF